MGDAGEVALTAMQQDHAIPIISRTGVWRPRLDIDHVVTSSDELGQLNVGGGIAVKFAGITRGAPHIAFAGYQTDSLSVWTTQSDNGFRSTPKISSKLTIRFVEAGFITRDARGKFDTVVGSNLAMCTSFEAMQFEQTSPGFSAITASVCMDAIVGRYRSLNGSDDLGIPDFFPVIEPRSSGMIILKNALYTLLKQRPLENDLLMPLLQDFLFYQLLSSWPMVSGEVHSSYKSSENLTVKDAIEYMESNLGRKIEVAEIARAAGVSVRNLQIAFKSKMGCSPIQFLIDRRMRKVYEGLVRKDGRSIAEIAREWGFVHMSDFSRRFRMRYGQSAGKIHRSS